MYSNRKPELLEPAEGYVMKENVSCMLTCCVAVTATEWSTSVSSRFSLKSISSFTISHRWSSLVMMMERCFRSFQRLTGYSCWMLLLLLLLLYWHYHYHCRHYYLYKAGGNVFIIIIIIIMPPTSVGRRHYKIMAGICPSVCLSICQLI